MQQASTEVVDCLVYIQPPGREALEKYMPKQLRQRPLPSTQRFYYPHPHSDYAEIDGSTTPPSDPKDVAEFLFRGRGIHTAILLSLGRGLLPDIDMGNAVCSATNEWLADEWLAPKAGGSVLGSISVNPMDPDAAVAEIERWAGDPRMVQVSVPLQSHAPYGHRAFRPIWQAAADKGFPVAVHMDSDRGTDYAPTLAGYPTHFIEYATLAPLNCLFHIVSLIAEGVFEQHPDLRFIFTDGGSDMLAPIMWRMDKDWRSGASETPWVKRPPSTYAAGNIRFTTNKFSGPPDEAKAERNAILNDSQFLVYGSGFPSWQDYPLSDLVADIPHGMRDAILHGNARELYRNRTDLLTGTVADTSDSAAAVAGSPAGEPRSERSSDKHPDTTKEVR